MSLIRKTRKYAGGGYLYGKKQEQNPGSVDGALGAVGSALNQVLPPLQVPYIAIQRAAPVDVAGVQQKVKEASQTAASKALDDLDKQFNDTVDKAKMSAEAKSFLKSRKDQLRQEITQNLLRDDNYYASNVNRQQLQQRVSDLIGPDRIARYTNNWLTREGDDKIFDAESGRELLQNKAYVNGRRTRYTNQQLRDRFSSGLGQEYYDVFGRNEQTGEGGLYQGLTRKGTSKDVSEQLKAFTSEINTSQMGGKSERLQQLLPDGWGGSVTSGGVRTTNVPVLDQLRNYVFGYQQKTKDGKVIEHAGKGLEGILDNTARQALEDKYDNQFDKMGLSQDLVVPLTNGKSFTFAKDQVTHERVEAQLEDAIAQGIVSPEQGAQLQQQLYQQRRQFTNSRALSEVATFLNIGQVDGTVTEYRENAGSRLPSNKELGLDESGHPWDFNNAAGEGHGGLDWSVSVENPDERTTVDGEQGVNVPNTTKSMFPFLSTTVVGEGPIKQSQEYVFVPTQAKDGKTGVANKTLQDVEREGVRVWWDKGMRQILGQGTSPGEKLDVKNAIKLKSAGLQVRLVPPPGMSIQEVIRQQVPESISSAAGIQQKITVAQLKALTEDANQNAQQRELARRALAQMAQLKNFRVAEKYTVVMPESALDKNADFFKRQVDGKVISPSRWGFDLNEQELSHLGLRPAGEQGNTVAGETGWTTLGDNAVETDVWIERPNYQFQGGNFKFIDIRGQIKSDQNQQQYNNLRQGARR